MRIKLFSLLCFISGVSLATPVILQIESQIIKINGKSVPFQIIVQPNGTWGYTGNQGTTLNIIVKNKLDESTVIHWHGIILPNDQDGVDGITQEYPIAPHSQMEYTFPLLFHGTYWMHSHYGLQQQTGVEAPLVILGKDDDKYKQVVVMFQDFSSTPPTELFKSLHKNGSAPMNMNNSMQSGTMNMASQSDSESPEAMSDMDMGEMDGMDLNDVKYDAYLTNYHSVDKPQITQVKAGDIVRLRFIDGAAASNFWINLGSLKGKVIAVDGQDTQPVGGSKFPIAMGQRVDVLVTIPKSGGTFPILGQVEGLKLQTGIILTTKAKVNQSISAENAQPAPAAGYQLEKQLRPANHQKLVSTTGNTKNFIMVLNGDMKSYVWTINNQVWPNIKPLEVKKGDLVNVTFNNQSMMSHPMHLHGYTFKVVRIDGKLIDGAFRDTVLVMPHSKITVQFVADNPGKWMFHCHVAYHMAGGMMTYLQVGDK